VTICLVACHIIRHTLHRMSLKIREGFLFWVKPPPVGGGFFNVEHLYCILIHEQSATNLGAVKFNKYSWFWLTLAVFAVGTRFVGYIIRIRALTERKLTWRQSYSVISLWELASALSPSAVGGTAVAMFILAKEKIGLGKSTTIAVTTLFLDLLYFVLFVPILLLIVGKANFFGESADCLDGYLAKVGVVKRFGLANTFLIGYGMMATVCLILGWGLFKNPRNFKRLLLKIFSLPFLKKKRAVGAEMANDVVIASKEISSKPPRFWVGAFGGTAIAWTSRFILINFVVLAFASGGFNQLVLLSRYFLLWIMLVIPSTPGASGIAEAGFKGVFCDFMPVGAGIVILLIWRVLSYYLYLINGLIILPRWIRRVYKKA